MDFDQVNDLVRKVSAVEAVEIHMKWKQLGYTSAFGEQSYLDEYIHRQLIVNKWRFFFLEKGIDYSYNYIGLHQEDCLSLDEQTDFISYEIQCLQNPEFLNEDEYELFGEDYWGMCDFVYYDSELEHKTSNDYLHFFITELRNKKLDNILTPTT